MPIDVSGAEIRKDPPFAAIGDQTLTTAVNEDDPSDSVQIETRFTATGDPFTIPNVTLDGSTDVITAPQGSFARLRVGDEISGGTGIPASTFVFAVNRSTDPAVDDTATLTANTTVAETITATITPSQPYTDVVVALTLGYVFSNDKLTVNIGGYLYPDASDGISNNASVQDPPATEVINESFVIDWARYRFALRIAPPT